VPQLSTRAEGGSYRPPLPNTHPVQAMASPSIALPRLGRLHACAGAGRRDFSPQEQRLLADQLQDELPGLRLDDLDDLIAPRR